MNQEIVYSVTDFVAICNQVLDISFEGTVKIEGELANYKISKNKWLYFDLKDENATLKFFGSIYQLPSPLSEGMVLQIVGQPVLHPKFGFSINIKSIQLVGEGTIKKSAQFLEQQLEREGLFRPERKRSIPIFPNVVGVISSKESAGFKDFIKISNQRWGGVSFKLIDVQVQGEKAPNQITKAIEYFNQTNFDIEVLIIIRGGGSADDLQAFNHERVVRAIAGSRVPTLVAIGHETDILLAERVADLRASTPSHASTLLLPERTAQLSQLKANTQILNNAIKECIKVNRQLLNQSYEKLAENIQLQIFNEKTKLHLKSQILKQLNPTSVLKRGYAIVKQRGKIIRRLGELNQEEKLSLHFYDDQITVKSIK